MHIQPRIHTNAKQLIRIHAMCGYDQRQQNLLKNLIQMKEMVSFLSD